jgi:hypothetical protein
MDDRICMADGWSRLRLVMGMETEDRHRYTHLLFPQSNNRLSSPAGGVVCPIYGREFCRYHLSLLNPKLLTY